jgi:23S rRNA (guanosine2251-2'-O)-methyltransferase
MSRHRPVAKDQPRRDAATRGDAGRPAGKSAGAPGESQRWLYGSHAVLAALANPDRRPRRLLATSDSAKDLPANLRIQPEIVERGQLDQTLPPGAVHQGIALLADNLPDIDIPDLLEGAGQDALILVLDQVTDPHNVGAIFRSAAVFGAIGIVTTDRNAPPLTGALAKAASGGIERVRLARVVNLARAIRDLQEAGFWCVGLDAQGAKPLDQVVSAGRLALVLGAEGEGLRRLTAETCDELAKLPAADSFTSLNVSNAAAVALYIASRRPTGPAT